MTRHSRLSSRVAAAVIVVAAALLVSPTSGAHAAGTLCGGAGVNVVVDFGELGGGVQTGCDPQGADQVASQVFPAVGFPLDYVQRQPGFVCRVSGEPAADPCVTTPPPNAYWGLWWSDGESGTWTYATLGATSLKVPSDGSLGLSWVGDGGSVPPGIPPPAVASPDPEPEATPSPTPTEQPSLEPEDDPTGDGPVAGGGSGAGGGQSGAGTPTPTPGTSASTTAAPGPSAAAGPTVKSGSTGNAGQTGGGDVARDGRSGREERDGRDENSRGADEVRASKSPSAVPTGPSDAASGVTTGESLLEQSEPVDQAGPASPDGRLPAWVPIGALVLALLGTAATVVVRRRAGSAA